MTPFLDRLDRRRLALLFATLSATYSFIGPGLHYMNPNVFARVAMVHAILNQHTLAIDPYTHHAYDEAAFGGHFYSDKAPGLSFTALPFIALLRIFAIAAGIPPEPFAGLHFTSYYVMSVWVGDFVTSSVFTAAAACAIYALARHWRLGRGAALFGALCYALATPALGWATMFFGHAMAGACLLLGFAVTAIAPDFPATPRRDICLGALAGALLGWGVVVEFTGAPAAFAIGCYGLWRLRVLPPGRAWRIGAAASLAACLALAVLAAYNIAAFGSATHLGYDDAVGFAGMQQGLFGVSTPRLWVLGQILGGVHRGILWISPLLVLTPLAWLAAARRQPAAACVLFAVPVSYLLINSGYYYWDGGGSIGPRHITPALAFLGPAFAVLWDRATRLRPALLALALASFAACFACAITDMVPDPDIVSPLTQSIWPMLRTGDVHSVLNPLGIEGYPPYALLAAIWLAAWIAGRPGLRPGPAKGQ